MSQIIRPWVQTTSGGKFHLHDPDPAEVNIRDIAEALSKICRFTGRTQQFYSVAQHSCHVTELLPLSAKPYGILHDAHEAFTGDLVMPMRGVLTAQAGYDIWAEICKDIERAIHEAFGLPWPPHPALAKMLEEADRVALATERRDLMADGPMWEVKLPAPDKKVLRSWAWAEAHHKFLTCFEDVCKTRPEMVRAMEKHAGGGREQ